MHGTTDCLLEGFGAQLRTRKVFLHRLRKRWRAGLENLAGAAGQIERQGLCGLPSRRGRDHRVAPDKDAAALPAYVALEVPGLGPFAGPEAEALDLGVPVFLGAIGGVGELRSEGLGELGHCRFFAGFELKQSATG